MFFFWPIPTFVSCILYVIYIVIGNYYHHLCFFFQFFYLVRTIITFCWNRKANLKSAIQLVNTWALSKIINTRFFCTVIFFLWKKKRKEKDDTERKIFWTTWSSIWWRRTWDEQRGWWRGAIQNLISNQEFTS